MKKVLAMVLVAIFMTVFLCSCLETDEGGSEPAGNASSQGTTKAVAPAEDGDKTVDGEGDIGDYHIKIVSAQKGKDYSKKDVLIVTYEWTNNSDDEQMFSTAFGVKAYQDGIECSSLTVVDGVDNSKLLSNIKPGATLQVQEAYVLNGDSDVEVEVGPWIDLGNSTKIVKTFSVK